MSDMNNSSGSEDKSMDNLWGEALNEQNAAGSTEQTAVPQLSEEMNLILDIPVKMTVELGRTKMTIKELLRLSQGSVVSLDGLAGEPLDILINGYLIAQGEVVVVSDKFGIRITDIITPSERMHRLSR
ncbi:flagellar motor switch protein FliN [Enterobacter hormaechei]|uniref:flagellar motor switch protein FliN n=1 Tax=Enterobacter cloacae complex TaxID=354276 RepID=UPI00031D9CB2|nr:MULTISPECIES: flagellar motor switch protein FliN [Enterobacter cloacae complex]HCJ7639832.1 flagellar motor switch protein FliN [Enterobacter hormaechei subsp. xiangfangensis]MBE3150890.1 flagellar motor switch protein FliN [Enterobacter cloacae complex sp. P30BA]MBG0570845.1 flagellar motor switch protein FliN [Enterobacter hormaechei]MCE1484240.1 flagellar motor switch protein FliN [Enterobacter hormaechei]MCE1488920.1 flagellar motor switch protein FliN [Enterobacter hormaechei]